MQTVSPEYAAEHLEALIERAREGEEIVIARGGAPIARLVAIADAGDHPDEAHAPSDEVDEAFHGD